ncbi:MAG: hypothetical protein IJ242_03365 [Clostridia bacterium]|nr:hypothetical protein [Clostridia bacterium]
MNRIDPGILDIELGTVNGLNLCHALLEISPCTNVIYLTACPNYSLDTWETEVITFTVKPLNPESLRRHLISIEDGPALRAGLSNNDNCD